MTYSSGLSAFHALLVRLNPSRIAFGDGYHGCHGVVGLIKRLTGLEVVDLDSLFPYSRIAASEEKEDRGHLSGLGKGDLIHVETPVNPTGEARDLASFVRLAREVGCFVSVDATFAPPPLQDPLAMGADVVMH